MTSVLAVAGAAQAGVRPHHNDETPSDVRHYWTAEVRPIDRDRVAHAWMSAPRSQPAMRPAVAAAGA